VTHSATPARGTIILHIPAGTSSSSSWHQLELSFSRLQLQVAAQVLVAPAPTLILQSPSQVLALAVYLKFKPVLVLANPTPEPAARVSSYSFRSWHQLQPAALVLLALANLSSRGTSIGNVESSWLQVLVAPTPARGTRSSSWPRGCHWRQLALANSTPEPPASGTSSDRASSS
jgi:hypothetical protein